MKFGPSRVIALLAPLILPPAPLPAQEVDQEVTREADTEADSEVDTEADRVGTLLVAHGGSVEWNARIHDVAAQVRTGGPVEVSFLMGPKASQFRFQDAVRRLEQEGATQIVVVPMLASSHSGHYAQISYLARDAEELEGPLMHHLDEAGIARAEGMTPLLLTKAMDASMEMATVLSDRALALARQPEEQALFLVGHGPSSAVDYAEWMKNLRPVADSVARITGFKDVGLGLLRDDAPESVRAEAVLAIRETIDLQHELTARPVVVVPILISKGYISTRKLPTDLHGLPIAYAGEGLLPHADVARWIERRVREASDTGG